MSELSGNWIKLERSNYKVTFYVLQETPINYLLGNEFLSKNGVVIDYGNKCLIIKGKIICFKDDEKECREILDDLLTKNTAALKGDNDLINFLKPYLKNNDSFSHFWGEKSHV